MKYFKHILFPITLYVLCSNVFAYQYHSIFNNRTDSDIKLTYIKCNHDYDYTKNKSIFTCLPEKKILVIKAMNFIKDPFEPFIEPQDGNNWESYYAISIESTNIGKIDFLDPVSYQEKCKGDRNDDISCLRSDNINAFPFGIALRGYIKFKNDGIKHALFVKGKDFVELTNIMHT